MAIEIERKFLVVDDGWREKADSGMRMRQGYLQGDGTASVRVRQQGERAYLNIKSLTLGVRRLEYEYEIPVEDAHELLEYLCAKPLVEKTRFRLPFAGHEWEVDVFEGDNAGLVVAEIELGGEDEQFERPSWLGEEVSHDIRYYNVNLVKHPYKDWT